MSLKWISHFGKAQRSNEPEPGELPVQQSPFYPREMGRGFRSVDMSAGPLFVCSEEGFFFCLEDKMTNKRDSKKAVVVSTFGSTNAAGRKIALDGLSTELGKRHPDMEIRRAYISSVIRQRVLASEGIHLKSPEEVLRELALEGYTHVAVINTELIPGTVYESMEELVGRYRAGFSQLILSKSLIWNISEDGQRDDIDEFLESLGEKFLTGTEADTATVLMCHGTRHPAQKYYSKLSDRLRKRGLSLYMYCLEASPTVHELAHTLKTQNVKAVRLKPLMYTLGKHVLKDMDRDAEFLKSEGFEILEMSRESLSSMDGIISMIAERADVAISSLYTIK